jgi:hypothetical protein
LYSPHPSIAYARNSPADIDAEVRKWLRVAYDRDAE